MTLTELTSIASVIAVVGGGTLWFQGQFDQLEEKVNRGHQVAKFEAILEGKQDDLDDMQSREMMYRALAQAGVITDDQRSRWEDLERLMAEKRDEIQTYETAIRSLQ